MKVNYFANMAVSDTKKYSHQIEDILDDEWRDKAAKLQHRRWKKIHDRESNDGLLALPHRRH